MPEGEQQGHGKGGAGGEPRPTGMELVTRTAPPVGGACSRRSPAARAASAGTGAVVAQHDLNGPTGELVRVDPEEEAPGFRREADLGRQLDGDGSDRPAL